MKSSVLVCLLLVTYVCAQAPEPISGSFFGLAGNGTIYYQQAKNFFTFTGMVQNPIDVSISYQQNVFNFDASVCLNYNGLPISGTNLESNCPSGGYGIASNATSYLVAPPNNQVAKNQYSSLNSRFIGSKMVMASSPLPEGTTTESTVAKVYVKPGRTGGFVVTVPDSVDLVNFYVGYSGVQCAVANPPLYPIGNNTCETIDTATEGFQSASIASDSWKYYQFPVNVFGTNITSFNVTINGTKDDVELYVQSGYYPTADWYINTINEEDSGILTAVIANPGATYIDSTETFFFGIYNGDKNSQTVNLTITVDRSCNAATNFGFLCSHSLGNSSSPVGGYKVLNATLAVGSNATDSTFSYEYTDKDEFSDYDYAYFMLAGYPTPQTPGYEGLTYPYYIRVTVANNDVSEYAPAFYAKQGGFPSAQSATYNLSTTTDISHQIVIQVNDPTDDPGDSPNAKAWLLAVQLKSDFSIWVGVNCAQCDSDHGQCLCNGANCTTATDDNQNFVAYYSLPTTTEDSGGACTCSDDDYDYSFDCSQKNNGNAALYIVLIAVGGMIVLAVAIGVPIYCYISNKKATRYDRM